MMPTISKSSLKKPGQRLILNRQLSPNKNKVLGEHAFNVGGVFFLLNRMYPTLPEQSCTHHHL
jgi:hypothetical protein